METREAIIRYKLAARTNRRQNNRDSYAAMEAARKVMLTAAGYDRAYSYMGEFCNLHERDFPSGIKPIRTADGRYMYSGWTAIPQTAEQFKSQLTSWRKRALHLARIFSLPPVERFMDGLHINYLKEGKSTSAALRRDGRGRPYILIMEHADFFDTCVVERRFIGGEPEARTFFHACRNPVFNSVYGVDRHDPDGRGIEESV